MTLRLSPRQAAARSAASLADLSTGAGPKELRIYSAPRPDAITDPLGAAVMLVAVTLTDPPGTVIGADLVLTQADDALIAATGQPTWAMLVDGNGDVCADMSVGPAPVAPEDPVYEVELSQATLYAGGYLRLAPLVITG